MMRILLLSQFYPPVIGGEERHVRNLGAALAARGHAVSVATQASHDDAGCTLDGAVRVHRLNGAIRRLSALFSDPERPFAPPMPDPGLTLALRRVIAQERPDVIHAHNWILHSYLPLKPFTRAPFIVTLHDYALICARKTLMYMSEVPCSGPAFRKCLRCAGQHYGGIKGGVTSVSNWIDSAYERRVVDKFLTVSGAVARLNRLPEAGVDFEVIPNFVPDDLGDLSPDVDPALLAQLPERFILMVGDLLPRKGVLVLLDAYSKLIDPPPLVLIGRNCPETPASLPPGVRILESWPHTAIMHAWHRCLFGVAPSVWHEPCATVVLEAMSQGKAMIVSDRGGMQEMVVDEETGLVVPPEPLSLAEAMARLIVDEDLRTRMGAAGRRRVVQFQATAVVSRIEDTYRALTAPRTRMAAE
jgi:glycosyltransferase involved in cell wall biosynthesis